MAFPYSWADDIAKHGWLQALSPAAIKLLWALGRFFNARTRIATVDSKTLQNLAGLGRTAFYDARNELMAAHLVRVQDGKLSGKYRTYRVPAYAFTSPVPTVPSSFCRGVGKQRGSAHIGADSTRARPPDRKKSSERAEKTIRERGLSNGREPDQKRLSANRVPTDSTQLGDRGVKASEKIVEQILGEAPREAITLVRTWAEALARAPAQRSKRMGEAISAITERSGLQPEVVREALEQAAAALSPIVSQALQIFGGEVVGVGRRGP